MSVRIERFEWDENNLGHIKHAHPEFELELLEEIVSSAKSYLNFGFDRYGKKVYGAQYGRLVVLFNLEKGRIARVFSGEGGVKMETKTKQKKKSIYNVEDTLNEALGGKVGASEGRGDKGKGDDFDFELPNFSSPEKAQLWLDSLPHEDAEVDERLTKRVAVTMNFHQLMVDGFDYLAKLKGIGSGKDLMYMVLNQYLNENLPDEF